MIVNYHKFNKVAQCAAAVSTMVSLLQKINMASSDKYAATDLVNALFYISVFKIENQKV